MNVYMIIMSPDDSPYEAYINVINHITMLKHHSKYCFVLDLKYICVLILLER